MSIVKPEDVDTTGATLTPEMIQKGEVVDESKATEADKTEVKAEEKEATQAKEEADVKTDAENESKLDELSSKKRSIYDDLKDKKKEFREAKSEAEVQKVRADALEAENAALKELAASAKRAKTPEEKQDVEDDIAVLADTIGGDPEAIKALTDFLTKKLVKKDGVELSKEDLEAVRNFKDKQSKMDAEVDFKKEWKQFRPSLKQDFPNISDEDLEMVQSKIFELAHSKAFHDKEVDYIYFKNKESFSKLISPKRQAMEGGGQSRTDEKSAVSEISGSSSPLDVMKAMEKDRYTATTEIRLRK